jgi:GR25 family glycosyltransferase involved in LPS biosynthesis
MHNVKKYYSIFYVICFFALLLLLYFVFTSHFVKEGFDVNDFMNSIDVIYWINLDRATDRKKYMDDLLGDSIFKIIPNIRISAVDGKIPDEIYKKIIKYNKQPEITDSEYGCLLSHLNTISTFAKSNYTNAIIFEDDISLDFKPYWKKGLGEVISGAPPDWDIIMLSYGVGNNGFVQNEYEKYNGHFGAISYLINKKGAKKLMDKTEYNGKYILNDNRHVSDFYIYSEVNTYVYKFPYFISRKDNDSFIHPDHIETFHKVVEKNALQAYSEENGNV